MMQILKSAFLNLQAKQNLKTFVPGSPCFVRFPNAQLHELSNLPHYLILVLLIAELRFELLLDF